MKHPFRIALSLLFAASLLLVSGAAAPRPMPYLAWEVAASKTLGETDALVYNGDVRINAADSSGNAVILDLNGKSVTINGNLDLLGTLDVNDGSLTVNGSITIAGGLLKMTKSSGAGHGLVTVNGSFTTDGRDHTGHLTAGKLDVRGDFIQYGNYSSKAFCPSGAFQFRISGTGRTVWFETPGGSWVPYNPSEFGSTAFTAVSVLSLDLNLAADKVLSYPHLNIRGSLNGKTLTVPAGTVVSGPLTPGGGRLNALGSLEVGPDGGLMMSNAADYVDVNGSFVTKGRCVMNAGTLDIDGSFTQFGMVTGFRDDSCVGGPDHLTVIRGANRTIRFDSPSVSSFGKLDASAATLTADSVVSLHCNLATDTAWTYPVVYYRGDLGGYDLVVANNLFAKSIRINGGTLTAEKNFTSASTDYLVMTNTADAVIVKGDFSATHSLSPACLTAGTLEIRGGFTQSVSATGFLASGTHKTVLVGANKPVAFGNPGSSWFGKLELAPGTTFAAGSVLSVNCALEADTQYTVPLLCYSGNLSGHGLAVNGNLRLFGTVNPAGATIRSTGDMALDGSLTMADTADRLEAGGDFTGTGTAVLTAGTAEFRKSFRYTGTAWQASGAHVTVLSGGEGMPVSFASPAASWFGRVTVSPGTTFSGDSALSVKADGSEDLELAVPTLCLQGTLNGRSAQVVGDVAVPAGATLTVGSGSLSTSGDLRLDNGTLVMADSSGQVTVGGAFTAGGPDHTGKLTAGRLTVLGDFKQLARYSPKSFAASGNHITVLGGSQEQHVSFATPDGSRFAKLYSLNPEAAFDTLYFYGSYALTSTRLLDLAGTGGTLVPAFDADVTDYIYVLPKGITEATLSVQPEFQPPNAVVTMNGEARSTASVSGVPPDGFVPVEIAVTAIDGIARQTYTVKVEQLNLDLSGIGLDTGALSPAFNPDVTAYAVSLPANADSIRITPVAPNPDTAFTIGGADAPYRTYSLKPGETIPVSIVTTGQDGLSHKTYTVSVTRAAVLMGFGQSAGILSPAFASPVADYTLTLPATQASVAITPAQAAGCDSLSIGSEPRNSATFNLDLGEQLLVPVAASAGDTTFTYNLTIWRKPIISGFLQNPAGTALSPAFDAEGGAFTLSIPASMVNVTIRPQKVDCTRLTIGGAVRDYVAFDSLNPLPVGESRTLEIVAESGALTKNFTLTVTRGAIVGGLAINQGALSPAFSPAVHAYTVRVPATSGAVSVTPTVVSGSAAVNTAAVNPAPGASADLVVTGTDGSASAAYTITVLRDKPLSGITLAGGTLSPAFNAATGTYEVLVPATTASVTLTPQTTADCTALLINGAEQAGVTLTPAIGASETAVIEAAGPGGVTVSTYTVTVVREALLGGISLSSGTLSAGFEGDRTSYNVYLPNSVASVRVTPVKTASCASFTINSANVSSLVVSPPSGGMAAAVIRAAGKQAGIEQTFTVRVFRIAPVTGISLSSGTLSPRFDMNRSAYTVSVPATTASVKVTPAKAYSCGKLLIDGAECASVTLSPGIGGSKSATITAEAVNGQVFTYTVTVKRAPLLRGITVTGGTLSPAFHVLTTAYTVDVPATTASVRITPAKATTGVYSMLINSRAVTSVTLSPAPGGAAAATIKMTATDRRTVQSYTVTVRRAALITGIATSEGALSPAFSAGTAAYTVTIPADTPSAVISCTKASANVKSVTINGQAVTSLTVPVSKPGGSTTATIVALATDSRTKSTYTVTVKREPLLSGITVAGGKLNTAFNAATGNYTVSVPATTAKVTLTPVKAAACDSFTIDGAEIASKEFTPPVGGSVTATVTARTALGAEATYTVRIARAALVTGIRTSTTAYPVKPAYSATTTAYEVTIPATRTSITIYATKAAAGVKSLTMNGKAVTSLLVKPPVGGSYPVVIVATAADGVTKTTYRVTVRRSGLLSGITADGGAAVTPAFSTATKSYTLLIPATQASVRITPVKTASARTVRINGVTAASAVLSPPVGGAATATISVTAADGVTRDTYTVVVRRVPPLTGVSLTEGCSLSPAFNPAMTAYTVTVPAGTPQVAVTPTARTGATFTMNGDYEQFLVIDKPAPLAPVTVTVTGIYGSIVIPYTITLNWQT